MCKPTGSTRTRFFKVTLKNKCTWSNPQISVWVEQVRSVPTEEVALRPQARPPSVELEDHELIAYDGVWGLGFRLVSVHPERFKGSYLHTTIRGWLGHHRSWPSQNWPREVPTLSLIRDEGLGGPSLLPRDRSDPHPKWHIVNSTTLCVEYVVQVWNDGLSICHNSSRPKFEALLWLTSDLQ